MNFTDQYPILNTFTYLNTASSGILSKSLLNWRREHDQDFFIKGSEFRNTQANFLQSVRNTVARFFNAKEDNTFLVPNFSFGFNTFLAGLSSSHRFFLLEEDYPSINYAVQSGGFTCTYLPMNEQLEESILEKIKQFKPTIFAFSLVQYISGNKFSFSLIRKIKDTFPDLMIVADGTQFCGTENFNFEQSGLDVLIASGYKWMLAGYGNGFVLLKDSVIGQLYQTAKDSPLPNEPFLKDKQILSIYFEPGHQDTLAFGSLNHAILQMEHFGTDIIEHKIKQLSQRAKEAFSDRGLIDPAIINRKEHSSIYSLNVNDSVYKKLLEARVMCLVRGKGVRIAFHFYNTNEDLDLLLNVVDANL